MFQETKESQTHNCCEKCSMPPGPYFDCKKYDCDCHTVPAKWEKEKERIFRFIPLTPQDRILIENLIRHAISEAVKEERERAEAEKNDCPGCIDC